MISLEEKLRPKAGPLDKYRDYFNAGLLFAMSLLLLPAWLSWGGDFQIDIAGQMASWLMPAAMGFMLALRCGAIDLSIWAVMSATGILAATLINAGLDPAVAFLASGLLGLAIGTFNALLTTVLKIPSIITTLVIGLAAIGVLHLLCNASAVSVADNAFDGWVLGLSNIISVPQAESALLGPLLTVRMLLVAASWAVVLIALMFVDSYTHRNPDRPISNRKSLFVSLCASGALSGVSGMCWLLDLGQVSVATRLMDSLAIPIAVIMAGGLLLAGRGRTMLVGIFLPLSLLLTNAWSQTIWPLQIAGHYAQLPALLILVIGVDITFLWSLKHASRARWLAWGAAGLTVAGLLIIPASCLAVRSLHPRIYFVGLSLWACGMVILIVPVLLARRDKKNVPAR